MAKDSTGSEFKKYTFTLKGNAGDLMSKAQSATLLEKLEQWQGQLDPLSNADILGVGLDSRDGQKQVYIRCKPEMAEILSRTMEKELSVERLTGPDGETLTSSSAQFNRARKGPPPLPTHIGKPKTPPKPPKPPRPTRPRLDSAPP